MKVIILTVSSTVIPARSGRAQQKRVEMPVRRVLCGDRDSEQAGVDAEVGEDRAEQGQRKRLLLGIVHAGIDEEMQSAEFATGGLQDGQESRTVALNQLAEA